MSNLANIAGTGIRLSKDSAPDFGQVIGNQQAIDLCKQKNFTESERKDVAGIRACHYPTAKAGNLKTLISYSELTKLVKSYALADKNIYELGRFKFTVEGGKLTAMTFEGHTAKRVFDGEKDMGWDGEGFLKIRNALYPQVKCVLRPGAKHCNAVLCTLQPRELFFEYYTCEFGGVNYVSFGSFAESWIKASLA